MEFTTPANIWNEEHRIEPCIIHIEKIGDKIFVNDQEAEMSYNKIQLRFTLMEENTVYLILDNSRYNKMHSPPKPIAEMYKDLGGI